MKLIEVPVKEKPIIFSGPMVRALLQNRKWQTRRVMQPQPVMDESGMWRWKDCQWMDGGLGFPASGIDDYAPYLPGDILWVRETFGLLWGFTKAEHKRLGFESDGLEQYCYQADSKEPFASFINEYGERMEMLIKWRPSIHMPREAARLFLRVTDVRVEQVQDIDLNDVHAEGIEIRNYECDAAGHLLSFEDPTIQFRELWDGINAKRGFGWDANPWVWVYTFERIKTSEPQEESL